MPQLGRFDHTEQSKAGERYCFSGSISVDKAGRFRIVIDDADLAAVVAALPEKPDVIHGPKNWAVYAHDLSVAKQWIVDGIRRLLEPEIVEEFVILYSVSSRWSAWTRGETEFWPQGGNGAPEPPEAGWRQQGKETGQTFSFGIGAGVYRRVTTKRGEHVRTELFPARKDDAVGPAALRLNAWACRSGGFAPGEQEMPYTEEAAAFFLELVEAIVKLGMATKHFLAPKNIEKSIAMHAAGELKMLAGA